MSNVKALKDPYSRGARSVDSIKHPAGFVELTDDDLKHVNGNGTPAASYGFCRNPFATRAAVVKPAPTSTPPKSWRQRIFG